MKLKVKDIQGKEKRSSDLPKQFKEAVRPDLIKKAFLIFQSHNKQPYGANPRAGLRASAYLSKRRHAYRGAYGVGWSRTPRKILSRRGTRINYAGAVVPQTVGGRRAHPPKSEKKVKLKINKKERRKAIRSALSASIQKELVKEKGYEIPKEYPFLIDDKVISLSKAKDVKKIFEKLGINLHLKKKIRAGKGKTRGRKYKRKKGPLLVTEKEGDIFFSAPNLNIEVTTVDHLNIGLLAPGGTPGRVVIFTEGALEKMRKEDLFLGIKKPKKITKKKSKSKGGKKDE